METSTTATGKKKVLFSKYELGRLLGRGASAKVYYARDTTTGHSVAVKCISKHKVLDSDLSSNVKREISIMGRLRHPNIVRSFEVLASRDHIYYVMEFAKGGELFSRLASGGRLSEDLARRYFHQLISAVAYCHSRGIFHRDLKPENLLLDGHGNLKVSDFGLSGVNDNNSSENLFHTLCGTPAYVAPEILAKKGYDGAKVDVWSCGVILFLLVAGYLPFNDPNLMVMYKKIYRGVYRCPKWFSPDLRHLVTRLLDVDPRTRISVGEILQHPWLKAAKVTALEEEHTHVKGALMEEGEEEDRALNAFDLISFSSGFDLSGLFEKGSRRRERVVARGTAEGILGILEEVGTKEGMKVSRKGEKGMTLLVEGRNRSTVTVVRVYRLNRETAVVEVVEDGRGWEALWGKMRFALDGLSTRNRASPVDEVGPAA